MTPLMPGMSVEAELAAGPAPGTSTESEFRAWYYSAQMQRARSSLLLAQVLVFVSVAADLWQADERPERVAAIAKLLLISPLLLLTHWACRHPEWRRWFPYLMCASILAVGLAFALINLGALDSAMHYDALVLVTAFTYFLGGLASVAASATGLALLGLHIFLSSSHNVPLEVMTYQSLFLLAINALGMISANLNEQSVREAFWRFHTLTKLSEMDSLTSLMNRRGFDRAYAELWDKAQREGKPLAIAYVDLDHFKSINDVQGHEAGDDALRRVAGVLTQADKPALCARIGGDELVAIWYGLSPTRAELLAARIPEAVRALKLRNDASPGGLATVSVGLALCTPGPGVHASDALRQADRAVYAAKQAGRNRVEIG